MEIQDKSRNIPSLDGMRAISILLVIVAHSNQYFSRWIRIPFFPYLLFAHTGVLVFFVISGFLITSLLLRELNSTGSIGLKRFYIRRAFRIFPAYYLYLGIILALALTGLLHTPLGALFAASVYGSDYFLGPGGGYASLQHLWSLSVEEQFYLLWPATLLFLEKRRAIQFAVFLILISPLSRVVTYFLLAPQHRAMVGRMFHSSIDTIMFGCLLALLWENDRFNRFLRAWLTPWSFAAALIALFLLDPVLSLLFRSGYDLIIGTTLDGVSIGIVLLYVVRQPRTVPGRILNLPVLRHIGVISYSLYLWQSVICVEGIRYAPFNLVAILVCAEISYWAIERPSLRLRDRLWKRKGSGSFAVSQT
jgi:peptidoglycan/LPS O-acetylase OafA/YrhL